MDPTFIRDKPGKSPMGMDLIPLYEGEENLGGGPTVVIDPVTVQNIGVRTALVKQANLYRVIRTVGHLDYNEQKIERVNIKFSGWIENLYVAETGQPVHRGQPMLEIYSPELVSTQEEYLLAYRNFWNPIYSGTASMFVAGFAALWCRPDLKKKIWVCGAIFTVFYFLYFFFLELVSPGYVERVWNLPAISGVLLLNVPLEELLFAFTFGMLWSSYYEHLGWVKIKETAAHRSVA